MNKLLRLPGLIDIHVHLRDPGQTYKEDFYTGTCAALAGGVTTVFDMPNNLEPIFTYKKLLEKIRIARQKAVCDYGLFLGTDGNNLEEFEKVEGLVVGLKIYLNLTTGQLLVEDDDLIENIFQKWPKDNVIIVHAEGEKIDLAINLASKYKNKLHITHISRKDDLTKVIAVKSEGINITGDTTPNYLFLTDNDGLKLGGFGSVKPNLATKEDQDYLWENLKYIDCLATDHAPHTIQEKRDFNPPSGIPGLETMLPLLLTAVKDKRLTLDDLIRLTNTNPQKIFGFKQDKNTYVEVDTDEKYTIENKNLKTKCGWSPFDGREVYGRVKMVFIRGTKVFEDGKILVESGFGKNMV